MDPSSYVVTLREHLEKIRGILVEQLAADPEVRQATAQKKGEIHVMLKAGDFVFLRRVLAALHGPFSVSRRLLATAGPRLYKVQKMVSAQACVLCDPDTENTDLGFSELVAVARLIPFDRYELQMPVSEDQPVRLEIRDGEDWAKGEITTPKTPPAL